MRTEDGCIIQECLNGKSEAFGILVDKYKAGIYAFVYAELRDFRDAQDVTQEVFLEAYRGLRSLRRWESFGFWLYRIARNLCRKWIRTQSRRIDREFLEDQEPRALEDFSINSHRENQMSESLREALHLLPETYREVLMLYYFGDMNSVDIARALGTSPTAIRHRLSRARARLKEEMVAMMDTAFEGQRLQASFTFRIVEAVKRININPIPRMAGLPWGLSVVVGVIITVMSLNPHISIPSDIVIPTGSPLPVEAKVLETGHIPVDILNVSQIQLLVSMQGEEDESGDNLQKAPAVADQGEDGIWVGKDSMSTGRWNFATSAVDGIIYAFGGGPDGVNLTATVEAYDPVADKWSQKANMPMKAVCFSGAVDGVIYVVLSDSGLMFAYDPGKDAWEEKTKMPTPRRWFSISVVDGILYVIGGDSITLGPLSTVEAYNPATDSWEKKADMPTPRCHASTAVVDGIIYAIGGVDWEEPMPKLVFPTLEAYDPATDTWEKKTDMPTARACCASALDGKIYAIGGSNWKEADSPMTIVEVYDPATDTWTTAPEMPTGRWAFSTSVIDGSIYAIGGTGVNGNWGPGSRIVEEYTPNELSIKSQVSPRGKLPTKWGGLKQ